LSPRKRGENAYNKILNVWNSLPDTFYMLNIMAHPILSFLFTYACESLFSTMNLNKSKRINALTDETSTPCVLLKIIFDTKTLSDKKITFLIHII